MTFMHGSCGSQVWSLNHPIRPQQQRRRDGEAEGLGGHEVDGHIKSDWPLHRQIRRFGSFQYLVDEPRSPTIDILHIRSVRNETAAPHKLLPLVNCRQPMLFGALDNMSA